MELTILIPCLNECESIAFCIDEANRFLTEKNIEGEILVADNLSTDASAEIAKAHGARVIEVSKRGYGASLRKGIQSAEGKFVIMADADGSYDLYHIDSFLEKLRDGADMVIGNRYEGNIQKGSFPVLHRYIGVPVLSLFGRMASKCKITDFHCGIRAVKKESFLKLNCRTDGMELASEMIIRASEMEQNLMQIPADIRKDKRIENKPHLRSIRDGVRHLSVIIDKVN